MNPGLRNLITGKNQGSEPLSAEQKEQGFKAWYGSKYLPHCDFPGVRQFISYRLEDSMPVALRSEWKTFLDLKDIKEKQRRIQAYLDKGLGECLLGKPQISKIVQENLWQFDGTKYRLLAWSIMPNHIHVAIEVWDTPLAEIINSWKGYTAKQANKLLKCEGAFWAEDYFDRRIRDEEHFWRVVRYIENNPVKAKLVRSPEEWLWTSARYRSKEDISARTLTHPTAARFPT